MNKVAEKLTNFTGYLDATEWLGIVDVELPAIEYLSETVKGAGIAGEINSPVIGHTGALPVKLNWRTLGTQAIRLMEPKTHALTFRGNQQIYNAGSGIYENQGVKITIRANPTKMESGKFEVGATTGTANELECVYLKKEIDGKVVMEIDKLNFIFVINGKDYLEEIRKNLGI